MKIKQQNKTTIEFPPGKYWVGDLCYIIPHEEWDGEVIKTMREQGWDFCYGQLLSGQEWACSSTMWGDGRYEGSDGYEYGVDAALIGVLHMPDNEPVGELSSGYVHHFKHPFEFSGAHGDYRADWDGIIRIGHIEIPTN